MRLAQARRPGVFHRLAAGSDTDGARAGLLARCQHGLPVRQHYEGAR